MLAITSVVILEKPTVGSAQARIPSVNAVIKIALNIVLVYRIYSNFSLFKHVL